MPTWLLSPYAWLGIALAVIGVAGAGAYAGARWEEGKTLKVEKAFSDFKAAQSDAALKKFKADADRIVTASDAYTANVTTLKGSIDGIATELKNVQAKNPLPHGCKPGPDRLRVIGNAVSAANAATGQ